MRFNVLRIGHTVPSPTGNWPISLTDNLCHSLENNIDAFVHEQAYMLGNIAQPSRAGEYSRYGVIFGTASDLPTMAMAQDTANSVVANMLSTLIQFVFAPRGSDSPGNVHMIGRLIDANADLPWAIGMLPAGATLMLNDIEQDGLTTSYYFNQLISMTDDMAHKAIKRTEDKESEATLRTTLSTTYLSDTLLVSSDPFFASLVSLHEASHVAHKTVIRDWLHRNATRPEPQRDAAFQRHAKLNAEGKPTIDLGFATLFLELKASRYTAAYFSELAEAFPPPMQGYARNSLISSIVKCASFVANPLYSKFIEAAGLQVVRLNENAPDLEALSKTASAFTDLIY